ncbi:hypothetical protein HETIRDRAFT_116942 [Heterobasidion irregulare TC 32-1]|uniref:Uncharacterized protein n=1 Tax=Heterobasidion irregulare (strain TC 32-1) TaxID=747525 RepID=W4K2Z4_HETIT|nr:uncharacterized protein HETIRDRAFT_116942 [Heterobasidion irregulare TC 32-1]ETW80193.1 hypothetical protein HETIRDRAFT_116942 [Heterobasidion irregulare TC 32-1]
MSRRREREDQASEDGRERGRAVASVVKQDNCAREWGARTLNGDHAVVRGKRGDEKISQGKWRNAAQTRQTKVHVARTNSSPRKRETGWCDPNRLPARTSERTLDEDPPRKRSPKRRSSCRERDPHGRRLDRAPAEGAGMRQAGADRAQLHPDDASRCLLRAIRRRHLRRAGWCIYAPKENERRDGVD